MKMPWTKIKELREENNKLKQLNNELSDQVNNLSEELQEKQSDVKTTEDTSSISFFIDEDLNVKPKTFINMQQLETPLLNNDYIQQSQVEDDYAYHLALILIASEVTSQIISNYEKNKSS